jgi:hypothetical protein
MRFDALERVIPSLACIVDSNVVSPVRLVNVDIPLPNSWSSEFQREGHVNLPFRPSNTTAGQSEHQTLEARSMMPCRQRYPCASDS